MLSPSAIDDLARRLAELVPPDARAARDDLVANFRDVLRAGLRDSIWSRARNSTHSAACCCARARWSKRSRRALAELEQRLCRQQRLADEGRGPTAGGDTYAASAGPRAGCLLEPCVRRARALQLSALAASQ